MTAASAASPGPYVGQKAAEYDVVSAFNKGNREHHCNVLRDIIAYRGAGISTFCDLGCGTGILSEVILNAAPFARGIGIDASPDMLARARARLTTHAHRFQSIACRFEAIDWRELAGQFDLVVSSLAIHHLHDAERRKCFAGIHCSLRPDGWFVLYDLMSAGNATGNNLLEYLACADIRRRLIASVDATYLDNEFSISRIIEQDRQIRAMEGDREASLDTQLAELRDVGFCTVVVFQEARLFGALAMKPAGSGALHGAQAELRGSGRP